MSAPTSAPAPSVRRRGVLAGLAVGVGAAAGLVACGGRASTGGPTPPAPTPPAPTPVVPVRLRTDWTRHPSGPMPVAGDEGVPFVLRAASVPRPPTVRRGALVADLPDAHSAVYVDQRLGGRLRRIGGRFGFLPGPAGGTSDDGSVCLAGWSGALPPSDPGVISAPVHLVVTPERWIYGVATASHLTTLAEGRWATPLPTDGTPWRVDVVLDGPRAVLTLPDGTTREVRDPAIAAPAAPVACWEFYRNGPGGAATCLYETWAG